MCLSLAGFHCILLCHLTSIKYKYLWDSIWDGIYICIYRGGGRCISIKVLLPYKHHHGAEEEEMFPGRGLEMSTDLTGWERWRRVQCQTPC